MKKLYRSRTNRMIFGVCGGLGEYFKVDPVFIRVLFMLLVIPTGVSAFLYVLMAILIPIEPVQSSRDKIHKNRMYTQGNRTRDIQEAEKVDDEN